MKAPEFWRKGQSGWKACLLSPLAALYAGGASLRRRITDPERVGVPVICVGNVTAGGSGKTPVVMALAQAAQRMGIRVAVVSRGYGGKLAGPVRVDAARHRAADVGDEPLLIATHAPVWVAKDRVAGARAAAADGAALILLDDGFQNPTLFKDFSIVVVDGGFGFGNGKVLPAGPLREGLPDALKRADIVLLMGRDDAKVVELLPANTVLERAEIRPKPLESLAPGVPCVAFAGIGLPEKFFATLRSVGVDLLAEHPFPDHFLYGRADVERLLGDAAARNARLVTTAKDYVKVPPDLAEDILVLDIDVVFQNTDLPKTVIAKVLGNG